MCTVMHAFLVQHIGSRNQVFNASLILADVTLAISAKQSST
jgi:hypothetical protein